MKTQVYLLDYRSETILSGPPFPEVEDDDWLVYRHFFPRAKVKRYNNFHNFIPEDIRKVVNNYEYYFKWLQVMVSDSERYLLLMGIGEEKGYRGARRAYLIGAWTEDCLLNIHDMRKEVIGRIRDYLQHEKK